MKRNRKHNIFGGLAAATLLLTTACADNADLLQGGNTNGTNVVTFTVQTNMQNGGTRGEADAESHISDGKKVDVLVFGVYEKQDNGSYTLAKEFGKGKQLPEGTTYSATLPDGLNAIDFSNQEATVQLVITSDKTYKVAFWAQISQCSAYTFDGDLTKVKVSYGDEKNQYDNNDELRDAFCGISDDFTAESKTVTQGNSSKIFLRRPFAQVNVGTIGWDYESTAFLEANVFYKESTITLTGLADEYDVLTGKAKASDDNGVEATFNYNTLPAFINLTGDASTWENEDGKIYEPFGNSEEFLKVKLYNDDEDYSYKKWDNKYLTMSPDELLEVKTEEYKYLSMCYVLVPTNEEDKGTTLTSVKFGFKGYAYDKDADTFTAGTGKEFPIKNDEYTPFEVYNVPAQANYRTNILGNNFFTSSEAINVWINQDYFGDYNDNAYDDGVLSGRWPHTRDFGKDSDTASDDFFTMSNDLEIKTLEDKDGNIKTSTYNGTPYTQGLQLSSGSNITFSSKEELVITIVLSTALEETSEPGGIKLNDTSLTEAEAYEESDPQNKYIRVYKEILPALSEEKEYKITGINEPYVLFVSVVAREKNEEGSNE